MKLLENKKIGIDISDDSILMLEGSIIDGDIVVGNKFQTKIEEGVIVGGKIAKKERLKEVFKNLISKNNKINNKIEIIFGLKEENIFSHSFFLRPDEISREKVLEIMEGFLPKSIDNYFIEYRAIEGVRIESENENEQLYIFVLAIEKSFLDEWQRLFYKLGLKIKSFKPGPVAKKSTINDTREILLLNAGKKNCTFSIFINDQLVYSYCYEYDNVFEGESDKLDLELANEKTDHLKNIISEIAKEVEESYSYLNKKIGKKLKGIYLGGKIFEAKGSKKYLKKELKGVEEDIDLIEEKKDGKIDVDFITTYGLVKNNVNKKEISFSLNVNNNLVFFKLLDRIISYKRVLVLGSIFLLLLAAFLFLFNKKNDVPLNINENKVDYQNEATFSYGIFLVDGKAVRENEIGGRFFEIVFNEPSPGEEIIESAKVILKKEIGENEFYWQVPREDLLNKENLFFPLKTNWFIGEKKDLDTVLSENIYSKIKEGSIYDFDFVLNDLIESTSQKGLYKTNLELKFYHNGDFGFYEPEKVSEKKALIINTRGNNINIRKGPGTNFPVVAQAREGENYLFLGEENSWVNIQINDGSSSWISSLFVKIID